MENHIVLAPEILAYLGPIPISNTLLVSLAVSLILIILGSLAMWRASIVPKGLQNFFEMVLEGGYTLVEDLAGSKSKVIFPIVMTFFLFIISANLLGLFPGFGTIKVQPWTAGGEDKYLEEHKEEVAKESEVSKVTNEKKPETAAAGHEEKVPLLRSINSDLNMTLALALISAVATHFLAIRYLGIFDYLRKWFSLNPIMFFIGMLEIISEITKVVSLSFRLFGNIFAGEVVLTTVSTLSPFTAFFVPLPFYLLELIVAFVQAAVFMMLTLVFMVLLSEKHESH